MSEETAVALPREQGLEVGAWRLSVEAGGRRVLNDVSLAVRPGELVAIAGASGAGKTTLLEALAGVRPPERGTVRFDGVDLYANLDAFRTRLGYVPQDDIVHTELPLARTLRYAARLRLPGAGDAQLAAAVREALAALDLEGRADVRVGALSGGQRKRASIAAELLTGPHVFFLDEPTSGLDPATGAELVERLRRLANRGATVVFTTHAVQDLRRCDGIVLLGRDGHLAYAGEVEPALRHFGVERVEGIYERLAAERTPGEWARRFEGEPGRSSAPAEAAVAPPAAPREGVGFASQWWTLTARTLEALARNRLTMAILLGSPAMVVAMFAVLFRPGAFDIGDPDPTAMVMIVFWVTFGAFFFGLTYGLLQIVGEQAILRRETLVGLRLSAYVLSKLTVLLPFLLFVVVLMLAVLRGLDRLPAADAATYLSVGVTLSLDAAAALALGLLASAAVRNAAQATLALPMLCFPAVLFSGAILPVNVMAPVGAAISAVVPVRWAFEAVGRDLGAREILAEGGSPLGPPLLEAYGAAATRPTATYWLYLALFALVFLAATWAVLRLRLRRQAR